MRAGCSSVEGFVSKAALRCADHIVRMAFSMVNFAKEVVVHESLKNVNMSQRWEDPAKNRPEQRRIITSYTGPRHFQRHVLALSDFECPEYGCIIRSRIGLYSYRRTHNM